MRVSRSHARRRTRTLVVAAAVTAGASLALTAPAHAAKPTSSKATAGDVTATVKYKRVAKSYNKYQALRLTVTGPTGTLSKVTLPLIKNSYSRPRVSLADINGDGIVDAIVDTFSGGAHCCSTSSIALSTPTGWAKPLSRFWGNYPPELKDIGGAAGLELVGRDDRFAYAFSSYAASFPPIQIFAARDGRIADVTREYPDAVRAEAAAAGTTYEEIAASAAKEEYPDDVLQSIGAGWMANLLLVGDVEGAKAVLAKLDAGGFTDGSFTGAKNSFKSTLVKNFVDWGYLTSGAQLGL